LRSERERRRTDTRHRIGPFLTTTNEDERSGFLFFFCLVSSLLLLFYCEGAWAGFRARAMTGGVPWVAFARLSVLFFFACYHCSSESTALNPAKGVTASTYHHSHHIIITLPTVAIPGRYMSLPNTNIPPADSTRDCYLILNDGLLQIAQVTRCF
jgi:hypothetical protein